MVHSSRPVFLVVEDDDFLREAVELVLSAEGHNVVAVGSGEEALFAMMGTTFGGLYTDINLAGVVDGWEVGTAFSRRWPMKPIVYASAREPPNAKMAPTGIFLRKPLRLKVVASVLAGDASAPSLSTGAGTPGRPKPGTGQPRAISRAHPASTDWEWI